METITVFEQNWRASEFKRAHMPFVESMEDWEILLLIGLFQERGSLASLKEICSHNFGTPTTIKRRIDRMKKLEVIQSVQDRIDRRFFKLKLSSKVASQFRQLGQITATVTSAHSER
jgi:DNA-binding MarR family transcriptional regulator